MFSVWSKQRLSCRTDEEGFQKKLAGKRELIT